MIQKIKEKDWLRPANGLYRCKSHNKTSKFYEKNIYIACTPHDCGNNIHRL